MECIAWTAEQARRCTASATEELSDGDRDEDGVLGAVEKEELRTLCLDRVLDERDGPTPTVGLTAQDSLEDSEVDSDSSQDEQTISSLRRVVGQCSQRSLRHRQVSVMLEARLAEQERKRQAEEMAYQQRQESLLSKGVTREHVTLLPRDPSEPMPTQINDDLTAFRQQTLREELKMRRERALAAFQTPWLLETERELHELNRTLQRSILNRETRASRDAYRELLQD